MRAVVAANNLFIVNALAMRGIFLSVVIDPRGDRVPEWL